jgi:prevent-host-death family protein
MRIVGMFKTKTHLPELIKEVESGEELYITNRGKKVAFIIPVGKYYDPKSNDLFKKLNALKKRTRIGKADDIIELKNFGRK